MTRSTKSIALVLIGSIVACSGCGAREEDENAEWTAASGGSWDGSSTTHGSHRSGGIFIVPGPRIGGGGFSSGGGSSVGGSARGGFGATGGGSASS